MLKFIAALTTALSCAVAAGAACAQEIERIAPAPTSPIARSSFTAEATLAQVGDVTGAELGLGYRFALGGLRITPIVGAFIYQGENDRYRLEEFSNGNEACRDLTNGRFADKENCDNSAVQAYGKVEAVYRVADRVEIGAGYRFSEEGAPYGTVAVALSPGILLKLNGGADYVGGGVSFGF
jgi:hypothetical protein